MTSLVIDCGSTRATAARLSSPAEPITYIELSRGYNAATSPIGELHSILTLTTDLAAIAHDIETISFYGAGCKGNDICSCVATELLSFFPEATKVSVTTDMLAAARALCGNEPGIVGILGTGSNSCLYDGAKIIENTPPLGYILGDEGSGSVLGRLFLERVLKGRFSREVIDRFAEAYPLLTAEEAVRRVYRETRPNAFLASLCPFISGCTDIDEVNEFVIAEFSRYIDYNLASYTGFGTLPIHFVGSIAHHFSPQLTEALHRRGLSIGTILTSPLPSLALYHLTGSNNNI